MLPSSIKKNGVNINRTQDDSDVNRWELQNSYYKYSQNLKEEVVVIIEKMNNLI